MSPSTALSRVPVTAREDAGTRVRLGGIALDLPAEDAILPLVLSGIERGNPKSIGVISVHDFAAAGRRSSLAELLRALDLTLPDGDLLGRLAARAAARDPIPAPRWALLRALARARAKVFMVGDAGDHPIHRARRLQRRLPWLRLVGAHAVGPAHQGLAGLRRAAARVRAAEADVVLVSAKTPFLELLAARLAAARETPLMIAFAGGGGAHDPRTLLHLKVPQVPAVAAAAVEALVKSLRAAV